MRPLARAALIATMPLWLAACNMTTPNPVVSRDPVPPPRGERFACKSFALPFDAYVSDCDAVGRRAVVRERRAVVRAKG